KLLPPALQRRAEIDPKGKVKLSRELESDLVEAFRPSLSIFREASKLGTLLLQLSPAFSPRKHQLSELEPLIEELRDYRLAIEFRNRNWAVDDQLQSTIDFVREHRAIFVNVDAPASYQFNVIPSSVDDGRK